jgi:hypothetical protein
MTQTGNVLPDTPPAATVCDQWQGQIRKAKSNELHLCRAFPANRNLSSIWIRCDSRDNFCLVPKPATMDRNAAPVYTPGRQLPERKTNMPGLRFAIAIILCGAAPFVQKACASTNGVNPTISKEPVYQSTPKYSLLTFGNSGEEVQVWMVEDGRRLFVDKNANGDLTDDGPPIEPSKFRKLDGNQYDFSGGSRWDFEYALDAITPTNGSSHTNFVLRRWNYRDKTDSYGLSLSVNGRMPMYAGWFGTFWAAKPEDAPVIHFGGPFTPELLRRDEFTIGERGERLSLCFFNPGSGPGAVSRLSIEALPKTVVPVLNIEWPTAAGRAPLRTSHKLTERCCYWEFYTTQFEVPRGVVAGNAKVSVNLPASATAIELTTTEMVMPVVAQPHQASSARK